MSIVARAREAVVKVTMDGDQAVICERGGRRQTRQFLSPEARAAMGEARAAYFSAERIGAIWYLGQRLPDGERTW